MRHFLLKVANDPFYQALKPAKLLIIVAPSDLLIAAL